MAIQHLLQQRLPLRHRPVHPRRLRCRRPRQRPGLQPGPVHLLHLLLGHPPGHARDVAHPLVHRDPAASGAVVRHPVAAHLGAGQVWRRRRCRQLELGGEDARRRLPVQEHELDRVDVWQGGPAGDYHAGLVG